MTKIAISPPALWASACEALGVGQVALPLPGQPSAGLYAADLKARTRAGRVALDVLQRESVDLIVDTGAAALTFVEGRGGFSDLGLTHERADVPLVSHLIDSIQALKQALPWDVLWSCLGSRRWVKAVADSAHADELRRFGIGNVIHMPAAALEFNYDVAPVEDEAVAADVGFVGDSHKVMFAGVPDDEGKEKDATSRLRKIARGMERVCFFEQYHNLDRLADPPSLDEPDADRALKARDYFRAKLGWSRRMCVLYRDRFVTRLRDEVGSRFRLTGRGWDDQPSFRMAVPPTTFADYVNQYRTAAVNVHLWDGANESTVTREHFEITAAGGFLLCHHHPEVSSVFKIGDECETFRDEEEMIDKIRYFLANPRRRKEIARAGQQRTLRNHLHRNRLQDILTLFERVRRRAGMPPLSEQCHQSGSTHAADHSQAESAQPAFPIHLNDGPG